MGGNKDPDALPMRSAGGLHIDPERWGFWDLLSFSWMNKCGLLFLPGGLWVCGLEQRPATAAPAASGALDLSAHAHPRQSPPSDPLSQPQPPVVSNPTIPLTIATGSSPSPARARSRRRSSPYRQPSSRRRHLPSSPPTGRRRWRRQRRPGRSPS